ncbi:MAG: hypothetical protein AAGC81_15690 [Pseudomonadota bacterium]
MRKIKREWVRVMVMDWVAMSVATMMIGAMAYALVSNSALDVVENGIEGASANLVVQTDKQTVLVKSIGEQDQMVLVLE